MLLYCVGVASYSHVKNCTANEDECWAFSTSTLMTTCTAPRIPWRVSNMGYQPFIEVNGDSELANELKGIYTFPIASCAVYVSWSIILNNDQQ